MLFIAACHADASRSAEEVEIHVLLFLFLLNHLLLLFFLFRSCSASRSAGICASCCNTSATATSKLEHGLDVLALAHLGEKGGEERVNAASCSLDEGVQVVLAYVKL